MTVSDQPGLDWTVVLRRCPVRVVAGQAEGGYTNLFEIICCDCGDDPGLDYRQVPTTLQRIRGPYPIAAGVAAYDRHLKQHPTAESDPDKGQERHVRPSCRSRNVGIH